MAHSLADESDQVCRTILQPAPEGKSRTQPLFICMSTDTTSILQSLSQELAKAGTPDAVDQVRVRYLGSRGIVTTAIRSTDFGSMSPDERREAGILIGQLKTTAETAVAEARTEAEKRADESNQARRIDLSLPGTGRTIGHIHPVVTMQMFLEDIFRGMGFMVHQGYEVETEFFNFDALNMPADHPARDMQDTFWLENGMLMRTHTSASQVRVLQSHGVPLRAIFPGRCFRQESTDASHETAFHQCEGLVVDEDITVANLLAVMRTLLASVFEREVGIRLRPGYFPFVEPGFELDLTCLICGGSGCRTCKYTGWIELMPCGMVHPVVLVNGGVDPDRFSGFAFGLGLTRLAMMKFGIPDIRLFHSGDIRFYEQFPATA